MGGVLDGIDGGLHLMARLSGIEVREVRTPSGVLRTYDAAGRGPLPTLVFVHGLAAGSAAQFVPFMVAARRSFRRVLALDLPGHGGSPPLPEMTTPALLAAVEAALDAVLDEPPLVYGNSLGGAVALHYGLSRPTRGLFLASPAGTPLPDGLLRNLLDRLLLARELDRQWWARIIAPDVRARFARPHIRALVESVRDDDGFRADAVRRLTTPTLLVWGEAEHLLPPEMLAWWEAHLPATIERPPGIGHVPHVEAPLWTWRRLLRFAEEVAPVGATVRSFPVLVPS